MLLSRTTTPSRTMGRRVKRRRGLPDACKTDLKPAIIHNPVVRCLAGNQSRKLTNDTGVAARVFITREDEARGTSDDPLRRRTNSFGPETSDDALPGSPIARFDT